MQTFRQFSLYDAFLQGSASGIGSNKNELCLCKVSHFSNPYHIVVANVKYISSSSLFAIILHLEGEEVFGSVKRKANLPLGSEVDAH